MSNSAIVTDALEELADLILDRDFPAAKRKIGVLMEDAAPNVQVVFGRCVATLEQYPYRVAKARLKDAAERATDPDERALIEACTPPTDPGLYQSAEEQAEPRYGRGNYRAAHNIKPTQRAKQYRDQRTPRDTREARKDAKAAKYFTAKDAAPRHVIQVTEQSNRRADDVYASGLDYDRAAVADVRNLPCVSCWIERADADAASDRVQAGHGDDGLCLNCRETGQTGIPELPAPHTRATAIEARCAFIAQYTGKAARELLRSEYARYTDTYAKATVHYWADAFLSKPAKAPAEKATDDETAAEATTVDQTEATQTATTTTETHTGTDAEGPTGAAGQSVTDTAGSCGQCGGIRQIRQGLCADCRQLDTAEEPAPFVGAEDTHPAAA